MSVSAEGVLFIALFLVNIMRINHARKLPALSMEGFLFVDLTETNAAL